MQDEIGALVDYLRDSRGLAQNTLASYQRDLGKAARYFEEQGIREWTAVDRYAVLSLLATERDQGRSTATINRLISSLRQLFKFLIRQGRLQVNPMETIDHQPAHPNNTPPVLLTEEEVEQLLAVPDTTTALGIRDRTILEVLDATGMRVNELIGLQMAALHLDVRFVQLQGNDQHERMVPLSRPAVSWLRRYLDEARPHLVREPASTIVFLNAHGHPLTRQGVWKNFKKWVHDAGISKNVTPQTFRYSLAVQLLSQGASGQVVQELLGYTELRMLRPYLKVTPQQLAATYDKYHPRA